VHVAAVGQRFQHRLPVARREDVREGVDLVHDNACAADPSERMRASRLCSSAAIARHRRSIPGTRRPRCRLLRSYPCDPPSRIRRR
jgi:hypothetical protein